MRRRMTVSALAVFIAVLACSVNITHAAAADDIKDLIEQYKQETECENVSVVVYEQGSAVYYGSSEDLYQIGSMTKAFTGLAVRKLTDEGIINEDAVISDYIPGFEARFGSAPVDITVRQLMEQKSGYTNVEKDYPSAAEGMSLSEWAKSISGRELSCMPGTEYAYSNVNYNLLGLIIENVSGMTYKDYMEQEILIPLGLTNTSVGVPEGGGYVEGTRLGYRSVFDHSVPVREASIPAGYFYSDAKDMGRWIEIWTQGKDVPDDIKGSLENVRGQLKEEGDYYSGWELFADGAMGHSGGTPNYSSRIVFDEKEQTGVCVLSNLNVAATTDSLCNSIFDIVSGDPPRGLAGDIWTVFDRIFTLVTVAAAVMLIVIIIAKKKPLLIAADAILILLFVLVLILFPMIFGAGMKEIVFTWAPWSLAGGLLAVCADIVAATVRLLTGRGRN